MQKNILFVLLLLMIGTVAKVVFGVLLKKKSKKKS